MGQGMRMENVTLKWSKTDTTVRRCDRNETNKHVVASFVITMSFLTLLD